MYYLIHTSHSPRPYVSTISFIANDFASWGHRVTRAVAVVVVLLVQASWARVVGIVVPLFLLVGGTISSIANDDNAIRDPAEASPFVATVLQLAAVVVALVAGVVAFRERRS